MARPSGKTSIMFHSVRQFREHYFPKAEAERMKQEAGVDGEVRSSGLAEETANRIRDCMARKRALPVSS
ncbi:MAG: hypothetical protein FJX74_18960 [Armatimonadetes bacterium]|nr:hypothetical protein [Armatimonadota bacterium]